jgi:hypothetical protein
MMRPEKAFRWTRDHDKHLNMIYKMYDLLSHINFPAGILRFAALNFSTLSTDTIANGLANLPPDNLGRAVTSISRIENGKDTIR